MLLIQPLTARPHDLTSVLVNEVTGEEPNAPNRFIVGYNPKDTHDLPCVVIHTSHAYGPPKETR